MNIRRDILEKYNTGQVYISPAAISYIDDRIRDKYLCRMPMSALIRYYILHLNDAPTDRCYDCVVPSDDVVIRIDNPINEELEWLSMEYTL